MICAFVARHLVIDVLCSARRQDFVEVLPCQGRVRYTGFCRWWHLRIRAGVTGIDALSDYRLCGSTRVALCLLHPVVLLFLFLAFQLRYALHKAFVLDLVLEERVKQGGILGRVRPGHDEEASAVEGVRRCERAGIAGEVRVTVGLEDTPCFVSLAEAVEEAEGIARRNTLVEFFNKDANVLWVDELVDEAAH